MKQIVFYSWQSDLPNACNRGFIQEALENAASAIASDQSVAVEPVVDRDTQGVPGSPDIASTIFSKITAADVFVADISIVVRGENRATPNPNVLIELGYALKALGHGKIILIFNTSFGKMDELPFDLRTRRILTYEMPLTGKTRGPDRRVLESHLEQAIRTALGNSQNVEEPASIPAIAVIEAQTPGRILVLRRNLAAILHKLDEMKPKIHSAGGTVDELTEALSQTQETVSEFSKIAEVVAALADTEAALEVYRWFGNVLERYNNPKGFSGSSSNADHDYFKFIGHELFVTLIAFLLREQRWALLATLLSEPIPIRYLSRLNGPGSLDWTSVSDHLPSLLDESQRKRRMSLHADILKARHTSGGLAAIVPMDEFVAADYFLFLAGEIPQPDEAGVVMEWRPWSAVYLDHTPTFLRNAERKQIADQMIKIFKVPNVEEFRRRMLKRAPGLRALFNTGFWLNPIRTDDINGIGTRE
jgi:hypothetical protein